MKTISSLGRLLAIAVLVVATFSTTALAQTRHTNRGKHLVGGHGSSHKGGHYMRGSSKREHLVGGHGSSHKGGRYVKN